MYMDHVSICDRQMTWLKTALQHAVKVVNAAQQASLQVHVVWKFVNLHASVFEGFALGKGLGRHVYFVSLLQQIVPKVLQKGLDAAERGPKNSPINRTRFAPILAEVARAIMRSCLASGAFNCGLSASQASLEAWAFFPKFMDR